MQELKKLSNGWYQDKDGFVLDPGAKQPLKLPSSVSFSFMRLNCRVHANDSFLPLM
jgi:hypothetical protein